MTDIELLQQILDRLSGVEDKLSTVEDKVSAVEQGQQEMKQQMERIENTVNRNYDVTLQFYGAQKEHNTEVSDVLDTISGRLDMHNNQIARNTAALQRIK